jgi:hypothetical protein
MKKNKKKNYNKLKHKEKSFKMKSRDCKTKIQHWKDLSNRRKIY